MNKLLSIFVAASLLPILPRASLAQQSEAPVYQEGNWESLDLVMICIAILDGARQVGIDVDDLVLLCH